MNSATLEDLERLERLEELIVELQTLADSGAIIVVEGRKDAESLRFLGIKGDIKLASQQPLLEFAELLSRSRKEIVLLTDWDKKGGIVARKIIHHLLTFGIMPNTDIRSRIRALTKKRIKDIESLNNYVNKLRYELHGVNRF
ncbi:MAG: toprim domain-containing protein [Candidatus Methanoperedens sp.]|nr:toprim domain-containing protein [Candidatus Methanoperedens sp.]